MNSAGLRVLSTSEHAEVSITELFHRINRLVPDSQKMLTFPGEMLASEALGVMRKHGYSQVPVVIGTEVLGLFSYRSFTEAVLAINRSRGDAKNLFSDLIVEECLEKPEYARVTDEFKHWFETLDKQDAVLIGEPYRLQGIVTPMDVLRYLYNVASPFVLVAEMELCLRALIRLVVSDEKLSECAAASLAKCYMPDRLPRILEGMTFHDYVQIVRDGRHWSLFEPVFKGSRDRTRAKLEAMAELRNKVFHFHEINVEDYESLVALRDWMLTRARAAEARAKEGVE